MQKRYSKKNNSGLLLFTFFLALFPALFRTALFPNIPFIPFAPAIAIFALYSDFIFSLWAASIFGLIMDMLSATTFGVYSISYFLTATFLYSYKKFFDDAPSSLFIYTLLISVVLSLFEIILAVFYFKSMSFSFSWILTDLLVMPMCDGIYAFLWFGIPIKLYKVVKYALFRLSVKRR